MLNILPSFTTSFQKLLTPAPADSTRPGDLITIYLVTAENRSSHSESVQIPDSDRSERRGGSQLVTGLCVTLTAAASLIRYKIGDIQKAGLCLRLSNLRGSDKRHQRPFNSPYAKCLAADANCMTHYESFRFPVYDVYMLPCYLILLKGFHNWGVVKLLIVLLKRHMLTPLLP